MVGWRTGRAARAGICPRMRAQGARFGQGLQLVNVLRDLPRDLRLGRCYLPRVGARGGSGSRPRTCSTPRSLPRVRPLVDALIDEALARLDDGPRVHARRAPARGAAPPRLPLAAPHRARHARPAPAGREPARPRRHGEGAARRGAADPRPLARARVVRPRARRLDPPARRRTRRAPLTRTTGAASRSAGTAPVARSASGSTRAPPSSTAKWRCGPVTRPVAPTVPMTWPAATGSPAATRVSARW